VVIDQGTAALPHWQPLAHQPLAEAGIYRLWRVQRQDLACWAQPLQLRRSAEPDWQKPRPERY
jgi:hypothetical protein